ncbi:hypothetical protein K4K58_012719 [Colletotrichum sp. SAR11_239]|nr:hypothetical protein K4K58_012719 [Colletotrichum sp. SAR11_239]
MGADTINVDGPDAEQTQSAATFHYFCKLPPELRIKIWNAALPNARTIEITGDVLETLSDTARLVNLPKPPAIRGVCHEAWEITEKNWVHSLGLRYEEFGENFPGFWFDPDTDIILDWKWWNREFENGQFFERVRNLAICSQDVCLEENIDHTLDLISSELPNIRRLVILDFDGVRLDGEEGLIPELSYLNIQITKMDSMMSLIEAASSTIAKQCEVIMRMTHALATQGALSVSQTNDLLEIQKTISKTIESQASTLQRLNETQAASKCDFGRIIPATAFPRFNQLPPEIRKIVWEMALPDARVFMPYEDNEGHIALAFTLDHKPPAIRSACKEAWLVTEENGEFAFGWRNTRTQGFWFNPSRDIVFFQYDELSGEAERAIKAAHTQNIAMEWYELFSQRSCVSQMEWARDDLKCQKLIVTIRPQILGSVEDIHHARLFKLLDRDYVPIPEDWDDDDDDDDDENDENDNEDENDDDGGQQWSTWAKLKKRLEKIQSNRLGAQDRRLVFEGMELLFNKRT